MAAGFPVWLQIDQAHASLLDTETLTILQCFIDFNRLRATNLRATVFVNARDGTGTARIRIGGTIGNLDGDEVVVLPNAIGGFGYGEPFTKSIVVPNVWSDFQLVTLTIEKTADASIYTFFEPGLILEGTEDDVTPPPVTTFNATDIDVSGSTTGSGYPSSGTMGWCYDLNFNKKPFFNATFGAETINPATVTDSTFFVTDADDITNTHIPGTVGVGSPLSANVVWFQPTSNINNFTNYRIHITSGIENSDGATAVPETWDMHTLSCS